MNLAGLRDAAKQDIRPDPTRAPRSGGKRFSLFDDFAGEKVFGYDEQIDDRKRLEIVVHEEQVWIVARSKALALRLERAVDDPRSEFSLLALKLEFLIAGGAEKISKRAVVRKGGYLCVAAVWAIYP